MSSLTTFLWTFFISILLFIIPLQSITTETTLDHINIHQFSLLFTNYLLFDHIDGSLNILSRHISNHFQDIIIKFTADHDDHDHLVLDMELLKVQLQAAIGSFVEDSLPTIWNTRSNELIDKMYLIDYVEKVTHQYCSNNQTNQVIHQCVEHNSNEILQDLNMHIQYQLNTLLTNVIKHDLLPLFNVTQQRVNSILDHFNHQYQHTISSSSSIDLSILHASLDLKLNLYLQSIQGQSHRSLQKFSSLCIE